MFCKLTGLKRGIEESTFSLRALGAGINPRLDEFTQPRLRPRSGNAPKSWIPAPGNKVITGKVLMEQRQAASAISARVLELGADFAHRFSFPSHFNRSKAPARVTGNAFVCASSVHNREIALCMAGATCVTRDAAAVTSAGDRRHVNMLIVPL